MHDSFCSLVFGGSGTLGRVVCRTLSAHGSRLAFTYHTGKVMAAELVAQLPGSRAMPLDLISVADIERTVDDAAEALGGLHAFVQCAAVGITPGDPVRSDSHQRIEDVGEASWDYLLSVNLKSTFFACRRLVPHMRRNGGGNIVLVGSIDGIKPLPSPIHYAASKAALAGMTQSMAKEFGKDNIRVNLVAPGVMEAGISRTLPPRLLEDYVKHCGSKRVGRLAEVAEVVAWLACDNTYITGQTIVVDGAL